MLKKKIDKADLTGLKIRTSPFYDPMIKDLGGAPVRIAGGEIYTALEKGVVDGACWPAMGALDYKWYEVAKYMVRPRFGEPVELILVNLNSWNRLPKDLQDLLTKIATEIEAKGRAAMVSSFENEEKELQKRGMELLLLPAKEAEKYLNAFYERSWEELILKRDSEFGPRLKEAVDRMRKK
jgi:TRAP-type C4-dicarboxylate transport system substrate-binding protein